MNKRVWNGYVIVQGGIETSVENFTNVFPVQERRAIEFYLNPGDTVKKVLIQEDETGVYSGWIQADKEYPTLILRKEIFEVQFPYGSRAEEEREYGTKISLSLQFVDSFTE